MKEGEEGLSYVWKEYLRQLYGQLKAQEQAARNATYRLQNCSLRDVMAEYEDVCICTTAKMRTLFAGLIDFDSEQEGD